MSIFKSIDDRIKSAVADRVGSEPPKPEISAIKPHLDRFVAGASAVDQFGTWTLVGIGATAALLVANISDVIRFIPLVYFKLGLALLGVAALVGLWAKWLGMLFTFAKESEKSAVTVSGQAGSPPSDVVSNLSKELILLVKSFPFGTRRWFARRLIALIRDPLWASRQPLRLLCRQILLCAVEVLLFATFLGLMGWAAG